MRLDPAKINIDALLSFVEEMEEYAGLSAREGTFSLVDAAEAGRYIRAALEGAPFYEVNYRATKRRAQRAAKVYTDIFGPEEGWGSPPASEPSRRPELHFVRSVNEDKSLGHWLKIYATDFNEAASLSQKKGAKPVCIVRDAEHEVLCIVQGEGVLALDTWIFDRGGPLVCLHGNREHAFPDADGLETIETNWLHPALKRGVVSWVTCLHCGAWKDAEFTIQEAVDQAFEMFGPTGNGTCAATDALPPEEAVDDLDGQPAALTSAT